MALFVYDNRESGSNPSEIGNCADCLIELQMQIRTRPLASDRGRPGSHHMGCEKFTSEAVVELLYISSIVGLM